MALSDEIVRFDATPAPAGASPWVGASRPERGIRIVPSDPAWPGEYRTLAERVRAALGPAAIDVAHVGSTSVPGLPAKPVIDIDLIVEDSADEDAYVPVLERAGFALRLRESWWYEHRMLVADDPRANLHVFSRGAAEPVRHGIFRDWLRTHPDDRDRYRDAKIEAAGRANAAGEDVAAYNARKQDVIREIYGRAFAAQGLPPPR